MCYAAAACECVQFVGGDGQLMSSRGEFTSPNYPDVYETNINCVLYTFIGDDDQLVQLTFTDFDMQTSITNKYDLSSTTHRMRSTCIYRTEFCVCLTVSGVTR